ncbi:ribonuclease H-like domain-containing protein [Lactarius hengduanensis]|nr:ribonuclease H-like domain-containing protein [Lactarius hengduanensis]
MTCVEAYGIKLKEADTLPLIDIGNSGNRSTSQRSFALLSEASPFRQARSQRNYLYATIRQSKPAVNAQLIVERGLPRLGYTPTTPCSTLLACTSLARCRSPARELPPPKVTYAKGSPELRAGVGIFETSNFIADPKPQMDGARLQERGMDLALKPSSILETDDLSIIEDQRRRPAAVARISRAIERFGNMKNISFVLVLLQKQDDFLYPGIKRLVPWTLDPKSASGTPSIVGVVASIDNDFVQFPASLRLRRARERENVLRDMIVERLQAYRQRLKVLPERMIVFRDGVSEWYLEQYTEVLEQELSQIFQAFARVDPKNPKYHPVLSIVVCGKRHHARFFPTDSKYADRNGNTRPGTVVDKGITSVLDFDFYLQAHAGLQGSVKSTHYVVLYDESSLTANDVPAGRAHRELLYALAPPKAVSLVPPRVLRRHCVRARTLLDPRVPPRYYQDDDDASSSTSTSTRKGADSGTSASAGRRKLTREEAENHVFAAAERAWGSGLHANLRDSMFYL